MLSAVNARTRISLRAVCLLVALLLWPGAGGRPAAAQADETITWIGPTNLSHTPAASAHPAIVTDDHGYVYVFWSEELGGDPMRPEEHIRNTGNAIMYTRWDGESWTTPIDIQFLPDEPIAEYPAVDMDTQGTFHLVWTGMLNLYYSNAPSAEAGSAHAWSKPVLLTDMSALSPFGLDVLVDTSDVVHVAYADRGDEAGVYYTRSTDDGVTWQSAVRLSDPFGPLEAHFTTVMIIEDGSGNIHTVWGTNQVDGVGQAVYYARSTDRGDTWSAPVQLAFHDPDDFSVGTPYIMTVGASELHLIYVDGAVIGSRGRYHRISTDGGETWSEPRHIITDLMGMNGYVIPVIDGAGQMHLIINMRTVDGQVVGLYYARWLGNGWSPVVPVDVSNPSAHYTAVAVRLGNELHVVYTQLAGGEIWHLRGIIPAVKQEPARPWPSPVPPTPSPEPTVVTVQTPTPPPRPVVSPVSGAAQARYMGSPLMPGVGAAFSLVAVVFLWTWLRSRRNRP